MWLIPGEETVPYHLGYAALAIAFGLDVWSRARAYTALGVYTVATGVILVSRAASGVLDWGETAEVPLMSLLMALMVWHVVQRDVALEEARRLADRDREQVARRERLVRMTSHEMRTPLTIAAGYVDVLRTTETGATRADLDVVREELDRLDRGCDRLLRMIRFHDDLPQYPVDLDRHLDELVERWRVVAARDWQVETAAGTVLGHEERLRVCLDTLVENAVRYTCPESTVRVFARQEDGAVRVGVADSGSGFSAAQIVAFNSPQELLSDQTPAPDPRARTGLGLSLVREIVESRGGRLEAGTAPEGGAMVSLVLPH
jgi:signal transduction histidine kinase